MAEDGPTQPPHPADPTVDWTDNAAVDGRHTHRTRWRWAHACSAYQVVRVAALLVVIVLALMAVRLPWAGDLGIHAATLERLRHSPGNPGDPLVDADVDSPYNSPWMVTLALVAKATGAGTFPMLHVAAAIDLLLLVTGIRQFVRTFTFHRAAVPLAILNLTLLYGMTLFTWSGFPGLTSLSLCIAYPSTFALGATFHLWALTRTTLAQESRAPATYMAQGVLLAVILLSHQFTGAVAVVGLTSILVGARPRPTRAVWVKVASAAVTAAIVTLAWPYYSFFSLLHVGGLEEIHKSLYGQLVPRFGLLTLGMAALAVRFRRDRRDPLVICFALGALLYAAGGITSHWSWGRVLPSALLPAQVALAVEVAGESGRKVRRILAPLTAAGLLLGCWTQMGSLSYVMRPAAIPLGIRDAPRLTLWSDYSWIRPYVHFGEVVMTDDYFSLRQAPAYGAYTVASGYPDFFLPNAARRTHDTKRYFAPSTSHADRLTLLREYHVRWVIQYPAGGGLSPSDSAVELVATSDRGEILLKVKGS